MRKINYATGRIYDAPQVLEIEILRSQKDEFGWTEGLALFVDKSRHIAGTVDFFVSTDTDNEIGKSVLSVYDTGEYRYQSFKHCV